MTSGGSCDLISLQIETDSNGVCQRCPSAAGAMVVGTAEAVSATNQGEFVQIVYQVSMKIVSTKGQIRQKVQYIQYTAFIF